MPRRASPLPPRPRPPARVPAFAPAPELEAWLRTAFLDTGAPLENPDHQHLRWARLGCLWAAVPASRHGRVILGQAEFHPPIGTGSAWSKERQRLQLRHWFGAEPDFLLTFSAEYAREASDPEFCALVEHELYHCGQARDEFGGPRFSRTTGRPVFTMRGHDVEEFVGVVRRYGPGAAGPAVEALVAAARGPAAVRPAALASACGTCRAVA